MKILIVEDDPISAMILEKILARHNHEVVTVSNGMDGISRLEGGNFDVLLTDWMMPEMDGIALIRKVRTLLVKPPVIIMITTLSSDHARRLAIESGADDFLSKPVMPQDVINHLNACMLRKTQSHIKSFKKDSASPRYISPGFVPVLMGASSGGPKTIKEVFKSVPFFSNVSFFLVLHGPGWMLETFAESLGKESEYPVEIATHLAVPVPGKVYLAPGDLHMRFICKPDLMLALDSGPLENFVRPSVDALFLSAAAFFGPFCLGVLLTGMGCDGAAGASQITKNGGFMIVQDPQTAMVASMPESAIRLGAAKKIIPLTRIGDILFATAKRLWDDREKKNGN